MARDRYHVLTRRPLRVVTTRLRAPLRRPADIVRRERRRFRVIAVIAVLTALLALVTGWAEAPLHVSGRIFDLDGKPIAGVRVALIGGGVGKLTDTQGRWEVTGGHRFEGDQISVTGAGLLPLRLELAKPPMRIVVHRLPRVSGKVTDETGDGVAGALVFLAAVEGPRLWEATAGGDGAFTFPPLMPPGAYRLSAFAEAHESFVTLLLLDADARESVAPVLLRQLGTLVLTSDPPGQLPILDGDPLDDCVTPCTVSVVTGNHTIGINNDLYVPWSAGFAIANRQQVDLGAKLERKTGRLTVTGPPGGDLWIGDNETGSASYTGVLPTGDYLVVYRSRGNWPAIGRVHVEWNGTTSLDFSGALNPIQPGDEAGFLRGLQAYLQAMGGQYGVWIQDVGSGHEFGYNPDALMEAASDIKIPVALYLLSQSESGAIHLDDKVTLAPQDFVGGTGVLQYQASPGDQYKYSDLLSVLIQQSDNVAWLALRRTLGASAVDQYAASLGAGDCHQISNNCTPHEAGILVSRLVQGTALNPDDTQLLMGLMENTAFDDRLGYFLNVPVAHKTGADGCVENDVGAIMGSHPFVVGMFTCTPSGSLWPLRDVGRAAYRYFNG